MPPQKKCGIIRKKKRAVLERQNRVPQKEGLEGIANFFQNIWAELTSIENKWGSEDPRILLSVAVGILTAVIWGVKTRRKIVSQKKQKEIAIQTGKVIRAKCKQIYRHYDTDENTGARDITVHGVYEYTVDGKTRQYRVYSRGGLPHLFLNLYYTKSPRKVFSDYDNNELGYSVAGLLGIAACLLTMYLTGYIF